MRIAMETETHSPWVSRLLEDCGHEVIVANSRKLRLIYENPSKDDRVDALYLARLARVEPALLSPVQHRGESTQKDLALLRSRDVLVAARTLDRQIQVLADEGYPQTKLLRQVGGIGPITTGRTPACTVPHNSRLIRVRMEAWRVDPLFVPIPPHGPAPFDA